MNNKNKYESSHASIRDYAYANKQGGTGLPFKMHPIVIFLLGFTLTVAILTFIVQHKKADAPKKIAKVDLAEVAVPPSSIKPPHDNQPFEVKPKVEPELTSLEEEAKLEKVVVKSGDNLASIFNKLGISPAELHSIVNTSSLTKALKNIHPQQELLFDLAEDKSVNKLIYHLNQVDSLIISRRQDNFNAEKVSKEIEVVTQFAKGDINNSLFLDAQKAGLDDKLIMELAYIFGWDIDFVLDIRPGDSFKVLFEENYIQGKRIGTGDIIAAQFINQGKTFEAIRFTDESNHTDYYSTDGTSMRKAFLRTPVNFTRISSRFSIGRKHPILHRIRAHKGVDYAAPRGTPVKASGDGKIIFRGRKGGYGNTIIVQHSQKYNTLYAHLNSFNRKLKYGSRVKQGQVIGYVGSTGLATGPHLHYEFHVNGIPRDALRVKLPKAKPISKSAMTRFNEVKSQYLAILQGENLEPTDVASN